MFAGVPMQVFMMGSGNVVWLPKDLTEARVSGMDAMMRLEKRFRKGIFSFRKTLQSIPILRLIIWSHIDDDLQASVECSISPFLVFRGFLGLLGRAYCQGIHVPSLRGSQKSLFEIIIISFTLTHIHSHKHTHTYTHEIQSPIDTLHNQNQSIVRVKDTSLRLSASYHIRPTW